MNDSKRIHRPYQIVITTLERIYNETVLGRITWEKRDDADYTARVSNAYSFPISFDFQGVESHPTSFTSRAFVNLRMPGMSQRFFHGTEGFELMYSLLYFIESGKENLTRYDDALTRLDQALSDDQE